MLTNPAVEQNKNITVNGPRVRRISPTGKEKVYGGNNLPKSQVLSSGATANIKADFSIIYTKLGDIPWHQKQQPFSRCRHVLYGFKQ